MKRGILLFLIFLTLIGLVLAQQNELSVTFYSFGKNATINLNKYFGEGHSYFVSQTQNVIVHVDQEKGIATITAKPGWEGSEIIRFLTNESSKTVEETNETTKPSTPETFYPPEVKGGDFNKIEDEQLTSLLKVIIDPGILDFVKGIKREQIRNISKMVKEKTVMININDEVNLNLEQGYAPTVSMNFSFDMNKDTEDANSQETVSKSGISSTTVIIALLVITVIGVYFYSKKHALRKKVKRKKPNTGEDIKRMSLNKLREIQNKPPQKESTQDFINVIREFFSKYFETEYDFEFKPLINRIEDSNLSGDKKDEIKSFLDDVSNVVHYSTEKWNQAQTKDLKGLIIRMKRIIQGL